MNDNQDIQKARLRDLPSTGISWALMSALLFGASTPFAKMLTSRIDPIALAGLLYFGSGVGLGIWAIAGRAFGRIPSEAPLSRRELPWLSGAILSGGIVAPVLLMFGIKLAPASTSSLLLNLETIFTVLLAWIVFREGFDSRILLGIAAIILGGVVLSWNGKPEVGVPLGPLLIAGACFCWGVDNNLTRRLSAGDPIQIAAIKGLAAGACNLFAAFALGHKPAGLTLVLAAGALGLASYGLSIVFFILALRHLGAGRTAAYFSLAPFAGAAMSFAILGERISALFLFAAALMGLGVYLHLSERHHHEHAHGPVAHEHRHIHDQHHRHEHPDGVSENEPHSHRHIHSELIHSHPHYPDIHHRHGHD